jgi:hypothetical protein
MQYESTLRLFVFASALLVLALFLVIAAVDVVLAAIQAPSIGRRLQRWARHYPAFAISLVFLYGTLLGHFFSQP